MRTQTQTQNQTQNQAGKKQQEQKAEPQIAFSPEGEPQIAVDGFRQVLEMLRIADAEFRESLLRRISVRDKRLALDLRRELAE